MTGEPEHEVRKRIETLSHVIYRTAVAVVAVIAIVTILPEFGIDVGPLIAGLGLVGLAVGFGAQNLVRDVINGLFILIENQYGRGDVVEIATSPGSSRTSTCAGRCCATSTASSTSSLTARSRREQPHEGLLAGEPQHQRRLRVDVDHVFDVVNRIGLEMVEGARVRGHERTAPHALRVDALTDSAIELKITEMCPLNSGTSWVSFAAA